MTTNIMVYRRPSVSVSNLLLSNTRPTVFGNLCGECGIRAGSRNICVDRTCYCGLARRQFMQIEHYLPAVSRS